MKSKEVSYLEFVRWNDLSPHGIKCNPCFGFVTHSYEDPVGRLTHPTDLQVAHFCHLLHSPSLTPHQTPLPLSDLELAKKDEALNHFRTTARRISESINGDTLKDAIASRTKHYLLKIITSLEKASTSYQEFELISSQQIPRPHTGLYVAAGSYHYIGSELDNLELVRVTPSLREKTLAELLFDLYPNGFRSILQQRGDEDCCPGRQPLESYITYEIPKEFINPFKNREALNIRISE